MENKKINTITSIITWIGSLIICIFLTIYSQIKCITASKTSIFHTDNKILAFFIQNITYQDVWKMLWSGMFIITTVILIIIALKSIAWITTKH